MNEEIMETKLIAIFKDLNEMKDTVLGVISKIYELPAEDYTLLSSWYEETTGEKFDVTKHAIKIRKMGMEYLRNKGIEVKEDKGYEIKQTKMRTNEEFLRDWHNSDVIPSRKGR